MCFLKDRNWSIQLPKYCIQSDLGMSTSHADSNVVTHFASSCLEPNMMNSVLLSVI